MSHGDDIIRQRKERARPEEVYSQPLKLIGRSIPWRNSTHKTEEGFTTLVTIAAKYDSSCDACMLPIFIGDIINYHVILKSVYHQVCPR